MKIRPRLVVTAMLLFWTGGFLLSAAQQKNESLPKVWSASAPFYPPIAREANVQGVVTLRVSTDGKHVVSFNAESGPPYLVLTTKENVKTWEFQPHTPASFEIRFDYTLSAPSSPCDWDSSEERAKEYVLLQLPAHVELHAIIPVECDPAVPIETK